MAVRASRSGRPGNESDREQRAFGGVRAAAGNTMEASVPVSVGVKFLSLSPAGGGSFAEGK